MLEALILKFTLCPTTFYPMLRKILLITGILSVTLVSVACIGADETTVPKRESYPTLLPLVEVFPTEIYVSKYSLSTPTPTPLPTPEPTKVPKPAVVDGANPTPEPTPLPVLTAAPTPTPTRRPTLTTEPTTAPLTMTRKKAIWTAGHGLSLSQQNLEGVDLSNNSWGGINFAFANLRKVDFTGAILRYANFRHADLTGADLTGADLTGADFTGAETKGAIFRDLSNLNWIDRELVLTGELPRIPNWFFPPLAEERFIGNAEKGDRVAQGQEFWLLSRGEWCGLSPTERLKVMDYVVWLGNDTSDWLDEQKEIRRAWDLCPPGDSSYWETKRPNQ